MRNPLPQSIGLRLSVLVRYGQVPGQFDSVQSQESSFIFPDIFVTVL